MIGKVISHYRVLRKLGSGGMGEVYLAQDTKLERKVALKFLPEKMREDPIARKRLMREAKLAAALDHPYICHIHEIAEVEGRDFIAMEYVPGESLKSRIARGPLPLNEAVQKAIEIAQALKAAHTQSMMHRDLKPANVMITSDGHTKLMDFGLVKQLPPIEDSSRKDSTASTTISEPGSTMGTLAYMSPEQLRGLAVDARSDIFSFGVLFYEMLAGVHPFEKSSPMETASAILHERPPPLSRYSEEAPDVLQHVVRKMLAKDPPQRYQSIHEVLTDLSQLLGASNGLKAQLTERSSIPRWPALWSWGLPVLGAVILVALILSAIHFWPPRSPASNAVQESVSIAVLPFADMSPDKDQEYFCEGLAEELISALSQIEGLSVTARTSAFAFKGKESDVRDIGKRLGVRSLLEGSVRKAGNNLRIAVQLINVSDGFHLWSKVYDREQKDVFAIQEEIAHEVVNTLKIRLVAETKKPLIEPTSLEAHNLYLKGRYFWNKRTREDIKNSLQYFKQALEKDPNYSLAYVGLADSYFLLELYGEKATKEMHSRAKEAATKAINLNNGLSEAYASLGVLKLREWDWQGAEQELQTAIKLTPSYPTVHQWYAIYLAYTGQINRALAEISQAETLDPLSVAANATFGLILYYARRYDQAIDQLKATLEIVPDFAKAHEALAQVYAQKKSYPEAISRARKAVDLEGTIEQEAVLGYIYAMAGETVQATKILDRLMERQQKGDISSGGIAMIYAGLGRKDQAFDWLQKACEQRDIGVIFVKVDPFFDGLREDPRFRKILKKVGLE